MKPLTAIDFIDAADDRVLGHLMNLEDRGVWPWAWTLKLPQTMNDTMRISQNFDAKF